MNIIKYRIREELPKDGTLRKFFPEIQIGSRWNHINDFMGDLGVCGTFDYALKVIKKHQDEVGDLPNQKIYPISSSLTPELIEEYKKNYTP